MKIGIVYSGVRFKSDLTNLRKILVVLENKCSSIMLITNEVEKNLTFTLISAAFSSNSSTAGKRKKKQVGKDQG